MRPEADVCAFQNDLSENLLLLEERRFNDVG